MLGLFFPQANEKGLIVGSIASVIAVYICRHMDVSWPWYAPVGTVVFLFIGVVASRVIGSNTAEQRVFIDNQRELFVKPKASHYGLLVFAGITILACFVIPDWLQQALA